ncbi:unnamed protein product [Rodentolepis nana]|uniref:CDV3 homolog n=1 Tax=Rodentolepis nana TaxID=102285 RepID=A0A0R3T740_RODNA|nr:unnamed protein product [Rodentolepis nana]
MSLDDFFNKKSKKKAKVITTSALLQQITDTNPLPQPEAEIVTDLIPIPPAETDEWEPIQNDIVPDFSELTLRDLDEEEDKDSASIDGKDTSKSSSNEVAWKNRSKSEEEGEKQEVVEPKKPGIFVPSVFSKKNNLPNVNSMDEFPTLAAVKDKPAKKVEKTVEPADNSWTDVQRGSNRRREETSGLYVPPINRPDGRSRYVPTSNVGFHSGSAIPDRSGFSTHQPTASSNSQWKRGTTIKENEVASIPSFGEQRGSRGSERKSGVISTEKRYVPPHLRAAQPISQSNRFAQLDNS